MAKPSQAKVSEWANEQVHQVQKSMWEQVRTVADRAPIDIAAIDGELLRDAIAAVVEQGDAFCISMTVDHGAISVRILSDATVAKFYDSTTQELELRLRAIRDLAKQ